MKIRPCVLWKVPLYCLVASFVSFYITVSMGFFYLVKNVGADGVTEVSVDPVRSAIFNIFLFVLVLLIGGLRFKKPMSKSEIAVSSAIVSAFYFAVTLIQIFVPNSPPLFTTAMVYLQSWTGAAAAVLFNVFGFPAAALLSCLAPFLFVPFGRRQAE